MSNIDIYKDNYEDTGADVSYKCRSAIRLKVKVQVAIGDTECGLLRKGDQNK